MECGYKAPGTYRIVLLGTSTTLGWSVERDSTFAALLPIELSQRTGRKIEVYNESMMYQSPLDVILQFNEVLAAKPDLILWTLPPTSPLSANVAVPANEMRNPGPNEVKGGSLAARVSHPMVPLSAKGIKGAFNEILQVFLQTRIQFLFEHFSNESQSWYVASYLRGPEADFLKTEPTPEWQAAMPKFDASVAEVAARCKAAGVPLVLVMLPFRAQAAMISMDKWPAGYDPYKLGEEFKSIAISHGVIYVDILHDFRNIPNPERGYFPVDGHPNASGHATLSLLLAKELTSGAVPALKVAAQPQAGPEQEK
jgi:hypothetical protein